MKIYDWLNKNYRLSNGGYEDSRFGDLAKNLNAVMRRNVFGEDFESYETLEDWLWHLDYHVAPETAKITMVDAWDKFLQESQGVELESIRDD